MKFAKDKFATIAAKSLSSHQIFGISSFKYLNDYTLLITNTKSYFKDKSGTKIFPKVNWFERGKLLYLKRYSQFLKPIEKIKFLQVFLSL